MSLLHLFRRSTAPVARERLQILLAHERVARSQPDLLGAVARGNSRGGPPATWPFEHDKVQIRLDRGKSVSTLEVDIEIPNLFGGTLTRASA